MTNRQELHQHIAPTPLDRDLLAKRLAAKIEEKGIPHLPFPTDANGNLFADKDKDPDLYDWAVNG